MTAFIKQICFVLLLFFTSCVSQSEYDKLQAENNLLAAQLEEERFGAAKLLNEAKEFYDADNMPQAEKKLSQLLSRHPDKPEAIEAAALKDKLEVRKKVLAEDNLWARARQTEDISNVQEYIDAYPQGRYKAAAHKRLFALKVKKMEEDYQDALTSNSANTLRQFLENYPDHTGKEVIKRRLIQAEVDDIFRGEHGQLPSFTSTSWGNTEVSTVSITNDTGYELTIRYVGPDTKMMEIPRGATRSISLSSGSYRIAASVNAANVSNYAGTEHLNGGYDSRFYIRSSYY